MDGRYGLALTAGMLATVNPCGLPMLPAYLSFFISGEDTPRRGDLRAVARALGVAGVVSLGFMTVFGVAGAIVSWATRDLYQVTPWISVVVGVLLAVVGVALLSGRQISVALPKLDRGGRTRGLGSMFVFGISYAIASISCTLPVFIAQVSSTLGDDLVRGVAVFAVYGLGMTIVLMALSVSMALARTELVNGLRRSLAWINRVAGGFLVIAGVYIAWYSFYEIRERSDSDPAVDRVTGWSSDISNRVTNIGVYPLAGLLLLVIAIVAAVAYLRSTRGPGPLDSTESDATSPSTPL